MDFRVQLTLRLSLNVERTETERDEVDLNRTHVLFKVNDFEYFGCPLASRDTRTSTIDPRVRATIPCKGDLRGPGVSSEAPKIVEGIGKHC